MKSICPLPILAYQLRLIYTRVSPDRNDDEMTHLLLRFKRSRLSPAMTLSAKATIQPKVDIRKAVL